MCQDCGCGDPQIVPVEVHERLLSNNDRVARHNREHFAAHDVLAINLMGSPGSGKTAILEAAARALVSHRRLGAVTSPPIATRSDCAPREFQQRRSPPAPPAISTPKWSITR